MVQVLSLERTDPSMQTRNFINVFDHLGRRKNVQEEEKKAEIES
jgi:hypothetical protein